MGLTSKALLGLLQLLVPAVLKSSKPRGKEEIEQTSSRKAPMGKKLFAIRVESKGLGLSSDAFQWVDSCWWERE